MHTDSPYNIVLFKLIILYFVRVSMSLPITQKNEKKNGKYPY